MFILMLILGLKFRNDSIIWRKVAMAKLVNNIQIQARKLWLWCPHIQQGLCQVDISEQSLVFHLYFQKKKLARTFKIFQAQKMFFEFANNAPNVVVEKVSFQEFHQMHQNWILHFKFAIFKCFIQKFWNVLMSSDSHQQKTIQYNFTKWVLYCLSQGCR